MKKIKIHKHVHIYNYYFIGNQSYVASDFHIHKIYSFLTTAIFLDMIFYFKSIKKRVGTVFNLHVKM